MVGTCPDRPYRNVRPVEAFWQLATMHPGDPNRTSEKCQAIERWRLSPVMTGVSIYEIMYSLSLHISYFGTKYETRYLMITCYNIIVDCLLTKSISLLRFLLEFKLQQLLCDSRASLWNTSLFVLPDQGVGDGGGFKTYKVSVALPGRCGQLAADSQPVVMALISCEALPGLRG